MASVRIDNFGGLVLTKDQKKGPFWTAMKAQNCDVQSGSVDVAYTLDLANASALTGAAARNTIYNLTGTTFLEWTQTVDIARSPLADNSSHRIYFTGNGVPQVTDASMATAGAAPFPALSYVLGIPIFPAIRLAAETGFSGTPSVETRAYTYTWVSPWGEEGPPATPVTVAAHATTSTVALMGIGVTSRGYSGTTSTGLNVTMAQVPGTPHRQRLTFVAAGFNLDFRVGDWCYINNTNGGTADKRNGIFPVVAVNTAGNGTIDIACNIDDGAAGPQFFVHRMLPVNTYNIVGATVESPGPGQVKVFVDTVEGLRVGESVTITSSSGITGLNATFPVVAVSQSAIDPLTQPYFVVSLSAVGGVFTSTTAVATRTAKHNRSETRITALTFAAGVATATVESTAHLSVGDDVVIVGTLGAKEANGKRKLLSVTAPNTVTFALASMTAYTGGGIMVMNTPYPMAELAISSVIGSGTGPYTVQIFTNLPPSGIFAAGDIALPYDVGGAVEINNLMKVEAVGGNFIQVTSNVMPTAYTAGGKILRFGLQSRKNIYRTGTGSTGIAEYQLVTRLPDNIGHFIDTIETTALGDVLESDEYIQPPVDMHSIVAHPSGFLMGLSGNIICKSVPYQPHAWPTSYQQSLPADGVGQSIYGTTAVVMTNVIPFNVTGYDPTAMRVERQDVGEPCTAHRSVTATGLGVSYRGTSGMFLIGYDGSENATRNYLPASSFLSSADTIAAFWGNKLIWIDAGTQAGYIFDPVREDKGLTEFAVDFPIYGLHVSPVDGKLYASYMDGAVPKRAPLFSIITTPAKFTYWTQYVLLPRPVNLAFLQVDWAWGTQSTAMKNREDLLARNIRARPRRGLVAHGLDYVSQYELGSDDLEIAPSPSRALSIPTERYLHVTVIANPDRPDIAKTVFDDFIVNELPVGMATGIEADTWQVQVEGNAKVTAISLAETLEELGEA